MLDPRNDMLPPPSSPTNSSISSSDLDTESTGSFFHDRSTTLGTLMGVTFPAITFRAPSQQRHPTAASSAIDNVVNGGSPGRSTMKRRNTGGLLRRDGGRAPEERRSEWTVVVCRWKGFATADAVDDGNSSSSAGALWRFPVSLTGICSGGSG
ncbi:hypothetical protein OIU79_024997 [Salix purpurea]|uniref:Uncharacterized protein n=1 Tax=Salix purpurea TaxID=77065 RepID=A0A9Q0W441_SALPP|nr:hypothetical protein OIU79_024997 [Salix purpurea]